jgi:hypothetical protein
MSGAFTGEAIGNGFRRARIGPGVRQFREPEVKQFYLTSFVHHDVGGLQVAVDYPCLMRTRQCVRNLNRNTEGFAQRQRLTVYELMQCPAANILHRDVVHAVGRGDVMYDDDVRVIQGGGGFRLLHEAQLTFRVRNFVARKELYCDKTVEMRIVRFVHDTHAALT